MRLRVQPDAVVWLVLEYIGEDNWLYCCVDRQWRDCYIAKWRGEKVSLFEAPHE